MKGSICVIPPEGDMVRHNYDGSLPTLDDIKEMIGAEFFNLVGGTLSSIAIDGEIVECAAVSNARGYETKLPINAAAMRMMKIAMMREGTMTPSGTPQKIWGKVAVGFGDDAFLEAIRTLVPEAGPSPTIFMSQEMMIELNKPKPP